MNETSENLPEDPQQAPQPADAQVEEGAQEEEELEEESSHKDDVFLRTMARAMPWVISLLFHVGLFLLMTFFVFLVIKNEPDDDIIVPSAILTEQPGATMVRAKASPNKSASKSKTERKMRREKVQADSGETNKPLEAILSAAKGSSGGASGGLSMSTGGGGGPRSSFFGTKGGNAYNIVYVIDRSGSMVHTFTVGVRPELLRSIGRLRDTQMFHIILFSDERTPVEFKYKKLVEASKRNKAEAAQFLFGDDVAPRGQTDPVPAIQRAMAVLKNTRKKGKLIYLLTDGVFPDNQAVLTAIDRGNTDKRVHINTFLYGTAPKEAVEVMTEIAQQNGGQYKFVESE